MTKELRCADFGIKCSHVMKGATDAEVLKQAEDHARKAHHLGRVDEQMWARIKAAIRLTPLVS